MSMKNIGIALLVVGVVLLVLGFQEFGAFGSSLSRAVGRGPSTRAIIMLAVGAACAGFGAMKVFGKK
jgi:uncharacterized membrane protein YidH (DUF202 family)